MLSKDTERVAKTGRNARDRVLTRKRRGLTPYEARKPEVERFLAEGKTHVQIAKYLGVGERTIRADVRKLKDDREKIVVLDAPKSLADLEADYKAMLEPTVEGFCAFFKFIEGKELPDFWREWLPNILSDEDVMVHVPPRHAKSTVIAAYCCWRIVRDRNVHIIWASKTEQAAKKWSRNIGNRYLVRGGKLAKAFGEFKPERSGEETWQPLSGYFRVIGADEGTTSEYTLQIRGMGQQILGSEADLVVLDDATDAKTARSEAASSEELDKIRGEFFSRLMPGGKVFVVGQRVAYEDLYSRLRSEDDEELAKNWVHLESPAIIDEVGEETLWPEVWPYDKLLKVRRRVGSSLFNTMYQQDPYPESERIFKHDDLVRARDHTRKLGDGMGFGMIFSTVVSVDPAFKKKGAIVVADVEYDQTRRQFNCWVRDVQVLQPGAQNRRDMMVSNVLTYRPDFLIYEDVGVTQDLEEEPWFQDLRRMVQVIPHRTTGHNKGDPEAGVESLSIDFENHTVLMPYADKPAQEATALLEAEAKLYPNGTYDTLMALWFIKWNRKRLTPRGALPTRFSNYKPYQGWSHGGRTASETF